MDSSDDNRLLSDAGISATAQVVSLAFAAVQGLILARFLGPSTYGTLAVAAQVPILIFTFLDPRSGEAVTRYLVEYETSARDVKSAAVVRLGLLLDVSLAGLSFLIVALVGPLIAAPLLGDAASWTLFILGSAVTFSGSTVPVSRAILVAHSRFATAAALSIGGAVVRLFFAGGVAARGGSLSYVLAAVAIGTALEAAGWLLFATHSFRARHDARWTRTPSKSLGADRSKVLRFIGFSDLSSLIGALPKQADVVILAFVSNTTQVGFYRVARGLAALGSALATPIQTVLYPRFARLSSGKDLSALRTLVRRSSRTLTYPAATLMLFSLPFLSFAIRFAAGEDYVAATPVAIAMIVGAAIYAALAWVRPLMLAERMLRVMVINSLVWSVLAVALYFQMGSAWGAVGAAWAGTITASGANVVAAGFAWHRLRG